MSLDKVIAALVTERFGKPPVAERYARPSRPPAPRHTPAAVSVPPARRWVCVGCGAPAHPGPGWKCAICHWSAYRTAPEVDRDEEAAA